MIVEELRVWTRGAYPRGVALKIGGQVLRLGYVLDEDEAKVFVKRLKNKDLYMNVFSYEQIEANMYDVFLLDVDSHLYDPREGVKYEIGLEETYDRARSVVDKLEDAGLSYRAYFSGRGFHIYVDYELVYIENFGRVAMHFMVDVLGDAFGYIDTRVLVDKNRVARVPFTYNSSAQKFCIPINIDWDIEEIVERAKHNDGIMHKIVRNNIVSELEALDVEVANTYKAFVDFVPDECVRDIYELIKDVDKMPRCIRDSVRELVITGELDHYRRLHMAMFLLRVWSYDDVLELLSLANDYNERMTRYQLDYILKRGLMPYSCRKALDLGICTVGNQKACLWKFISDNWIGSIFVDVKKLKELGGEDIDEVSNSYDK